ncbi:MAG: glycosyltransferase family 4 protein [Chloroflexi bacterium]|nr:glycosyltransferase family 4 protein [Chloroflexota bacterium]
MTRIKVLEIGKSTAGIGTYLRWLAQGLDLQRFQLTFACLSENGMELADELRSIEGVSAIAWPMKRFKVDLVSDLTLTLRIARLIRAEKFDLVHAHGSKSGFLVRLAAMGSGVPVVYSPHCFSFHAGVNRATSNILAALERFAAKYLTAKIITVSNGEQALASRFRVGNAKLFVTIHSGIDLLRYESPVDKSVQKSKLGLDENSLLIGAVGRLGEQKSPLDFVRMAALVHAKNPQTNFVWAGSGPLEGEARKLSEELGLADVCHFIGEYKDVPALLRVMDCLVLPSLWEGLPIVLLEAMASGVPIVATNIPGNNEAVSSGKNGWLVPPHDPFALADKVISLLNDSVQSSTFVAAGLVRIREEFTRTQMITAIQNIYQEVVDEKMHKKK